jgi:dihydrofolate reductase
VVYRTVDEPSWSAMSKLILHMLMSIDGFIADHDDVVNPATQWDLEMHRFYLELFTDVGAAIFGRRLYDQYVLHWNQVAEGAIPPATPVELQWTQRLRDMPKHVITRSRPELVANTEILTGDISQRIVDLKQETDGDLLLLCGPSLFAQLTADGLIDRYMLYVCPSALGQGVHLFRDLPGHLVLEHLRTVPFSSGVNLLSYAPVYRDVDGSVQVPS